jgi:3-oxoacyl-[acyl-carrier-protein] synthase II
MSRNVVITGLGVVSGFGIGMEPLWAALCEGRSCLAPIRRFDASGFACRVAGELPDGFAAKDHVPKSYRKATKVMARDSEIAVAAAKSAVEDAKLITRGTIDTDAEGGAAPTTTYPASRLGCQIGAGLIAAETDEMAGAMATAVGEDGKFTLRRWGGEGGKGMEALTPLWLLKYLPNMLACHVTIIHGAEGPSNTITCAEASATLSIGESMRVIERGAADACFSGGCESRVNVMGLLRWELARMLASSGNEREGWKLVRPFDVAAAESSGGVLGEGGGIVILEEESAAKRRGARTYARLAGFGSSHSDPNPTDATQDEGFRFAIENALEDAGVKPEQIDAILPMAAGVKKFDDAEATALRAIFGQRLASIPMVTLTPNVGNCTAGTGGLQVAVAAKCLAEQKLPARIHGGKPAAGLDVGAVKSRAANLSYVLVCTGSLGGQNGAVVLARS